MVPSAPAAVPAGQLGVVWAVSGPEHLLKSWDPAGLTRLKAAASQERDPETGKLTAYKGVLLSQVIEQAMESLAVEQKAQVDLVVFRNASGAQALVPRSVITKYPVLLALRDGKVSLVMPWTSKPRIMQEGLPVETYFLSDVTRVELANYRERFAHIFLKRRTDPMAMRGEKIFVQNCISCHAGGRTPDVSDLSGEAHARRLASTGHPQIKGAPKLNERDRKALINYLDTFRAENPAAGSRTAKPAGGDDRSQQASL